MSLRAQSFLGKQVTQIQEACPSAIGNIRENSYNQSKAVNEVGYGPLDLDVVEPGFWEAKANERNTDIATAQTMLCGNCAAFDQSEKIMQCLQQQSNAEYALDNDLGYCQALDFTCTAQRTCDAWMPEREDPVGFDPELDVSGMPYVQY